MYSNYTYNERIVIILLLQLFLYVSQTVEKCSPRYVIRLIDQILSRVQNDTVIQLPSSAKI